MSKKITFLLLVSLCLSSNILAENIFLKSGKTIEGQITEITDKYIKVNVEGVPITYYFNEIKHIDGKEVAVFLSKKNTFHINKNLPLAQEKAYASDNRYWILWFNRVSGYVEEMGKIGAEIQNMQIQIQTFRATAQSNDKKHVNELYQDILSQLAIVTHELNILKPPPEFEVYHEKVIEETKYARLTNEAAFKEDRNSVWLNMCRILRCRIEAAEEMKRLYVKHNAPKQFIEDIDTAIAQLNSTLNTIK